MSHPATPIRPLAFAMVSAAIILAAHAADPAAPSLRTTQSFDSGWRFARFGLQADGSKLDEPGQARPSVRLSASSEEVGPDRSHVAANVLDGNRETRWCASGPGGGQWLELDLGTPTHIAKADIVWEVEHPGYQAEITGSIDGRIWQPLPGSFRHIHIKVTAQPPGKWASIREIKLTRTHGTVVGNRMISTGQSPVDPSFNDATWRKLDLPHDWAILWSTGNECEEQYEPELGIVRHLTDTVHRFDTTRPATFGASYPSRSAMNGTELQVDVHGMNYAVGCYGGPDFYGQFLSKSGHEKLAGYSSESSSTISTRGEYPPELGPWQVSSYDQGVGWGSLADQEFAAIEKYPGIAGEFVWTGFDYLGEPTPFNSDTTNLLNYHSEAERKQAAAELERIKNSRPPSRSSYFGIVDLAGFPKDRYYLYQAHWRPDFPMAHILPHWNWPGREGQAIQVQVHTSGDEAELFLNGQSLGRKKKEKFQYRLSWPGVKYQPGELKVIAYKGGRKWAEDVMKTTGPAAQLLLKADRSTIKSDGDDLSFITVKVADPNGLTVPRAKPEIRFAIQGPGEIVATDNGDPTCLIEFSNHRRPAFNGLALVIVKAARGQSGTITVTAGSNGLKSAPVEITAQKP